MKKGTVLFANFVCTYGDKGGFVDFLDIALPAFTNDTLIRTYGDTRYHLFNVRLHDESVKGEPAVVTVSGHFVKNTILSREQIFDEKAGIVRDRQSMRSAPSAFFVFVLNTHRLVYYAETAHAPDLKAFEATMASFLRKTRDSAISEQFEADKRRGNKSLLMAKFPRPSLKVVPLAEEESITEYMTRFEKIESVRFRLIRPNDEVDASDLIASVRQKMGPLNPSTLDIVAKNREGLEKSELIETVSEAAQGGNADIQISGEDKDGTHLKGTNDQFALTTELDEPDKTEQGLRKQLFSIYRSFVAAGKLKIGAMSADVASKVQGLASLL